MSEDVYDRALRRIVRISVVLGVAGVIAVLVMWGTRAAAGFLCGALLSFLNLRWWKTVTGAIGGSGRAPLRASAVVLALRYLLFAGAIYVIVKILKITPAAPLAGLLVSAAAVMLEALYELIYART